MVSKIKIPYSRKLSRYQILAVFVDDCRINNKSPIGAFLLRYFKASDDTAKLPGPPCTLALWAEPDQASVIASIHEN